MERRAKPGFLDEAGGREGGLSSSWAVARSPSDLSFLEQQTGVSLAKGLAGSPPLAVKKPGHLRRTGRVTRLPALEPAFQSRKTMTAWLCVAPCLCEGVRFGMFLLEVSIWQTSS